MNFGQKDFALLVGSALFLILVSFVFPAIGFASEDINSTEIPSYNLSEGQFSYVTNTPEYPSRATEGTLTYVDNQDVYQDNRRVWLQGNSNDGFEVTLTNNGTIANPNASLYLNQYNSSGFVTSSSTEMTESDNFSKLELSGYIVTFENVRFSNVNNSDMTMQVDYYVKQTAAGASAVGQIPIIGGVASATAEAIDHAVSVLGWIGSVIFQPIYNTMVRITNTLIAFYNVLKFFIGLLYWILSTYGSVVAASPANWVGLFLAVPGIVFSLIFSKLIIIAVRTIGGIVPLT